MLKEMRAKTPHLFPFVIYLTGPIFVAFFQGKKIREITKGISIVSTSSLFASLVEEVVLEKVEQKCKTARRLTKFLAFIGNVFIATTVAEM
jgi:hypothetical protein